MLVVKPICYIFRSPTHYVFIHESQNATLDKRMSGTLIKNPELPKGSNNRKGSADMKSISSDGK
jgi:hypothetical protein